MKVCGVGINDSKTNISRFDNIDGKRKKVYCPYYQKWKDMLARCYVESNLEKYPSYRGCTVIDEWLIFSNFRSWMCSQDWEGKCLDKDILYPDNKVYSPETCIFVSQEVNSFILEREASRGKYPLGVSFHTKSGKYRARCCIGNGKAITIGYYDDPNFAHLKWLEYKKQLSIKLASVQTDQRVAEALIKRYTKYN